ncbi:MAG: hypothetical protein ACLQU3_34145 [Limisphaerales bacterium]
MSTRSIEIYGKAQESQEKLDYFICGVAGALFAYVGQSYVPRKLQFGASVLEPLALLFFVTSFLLGVKRLETVILAKISNHKMLEAGEKAGALTKGLLSGGHGPFFNSQGGEFTDRQTLEAQRIEHLNEKAVAEGLCHSLGKEAHHYYKLRNLFLFVGCLALFVSKLVQPYTVSKPANSQGPTNIVPVATVTNRP